MAQPAVHPTSCLNNPAPYIMTQQQKRCRCATLTNEFLGCAVLRPAPHRFARNDDDGAPRLDRRKVAKERAFLGPCILQRTDTAKIRGSDIMPSDSIASTPHQGCQESYQRDSRKIRFFATGPEPPSTSTRTTCDLAVNACRTIRKEVDHARAQSFAPKPVRRISSGIVRRHLSLGATCVAMSMRRGVAPEDYPFVIVRGLWA